MIIMMLGMQGCLSGDSLINVNRCKKGFSFRIDYMYKMFHNNYKDKSKQWNLSKPTFVRSYDGERIVLHKIKDVVYSGGKNVFKLKLKNGLEITATAEHKIMTSLGWIKLHNLNSTDKIMIDTLKPQIGKKKSYKFKDATINGGFHPYSNCRNELEVHRLCYDAGINNLPYIDFMDILWNDEQKSKTLVYINPSLYHIHHKDRNHYNNAFENLECKPKKDHCKHHGIAENFKNFNQGVPRYSQFESIIYVGCLKTYDIICEDPYHNFVANGIVVHNSGKTASCVREMMKDRTNRMYFSNIITKKLKNNILLKPEMIINKIPVLNNNGQPCIRAGKEVNKYTVNKDFWQSAVKKYGSLNIIIDEAHSILNARRSMASHVQPILDWMSLLRRVIGSTDSGYGRLFLISQIERRLDIVAKEQSTQVRYHICHYKKRCPSCGIRINENNEVPNPLEMCPRCDVMMKKEDHQIEIFYFQDYDAFLMWKYVRKGTKTFYQHELITDIEQVFPFYDTLQWDNLLVDV